MVWGVFVYGVAPFAEVGCEGWGGGDVGCWGCGGEVYCVEGHGWCWCCSWCCDCCGVKFRYRYTDTSGQDTKSRTASYPAGDSKEDEEEKDGEGDEYELDGAVCRRCACCSKLMPNRTLALRSLRPGKALLLVIVVFSGVAVSAAISVAAAFVVVAFVLVAAGFFFVLVEKPENVNVATIPQRSCSVTPIIFPICLFV